MSSRAGAPSFQALIRDFFCERLIEQRRASPRTIASYRDAFRLLFQYAAQCTKRTPDALSLAEIDAPLVLGFLEHLEKARGNSIRSRNARLVAVRSFLRYASFRDPSALPSIQRVLAIPTKRFNRPLLGFLTVEEIQAVLSQPDGSTWTGARDHAMFTTFYNTGARVSEIIGLSVADVTFGPSASVRFVGKGRKERATPLWPSTARLLKAWLRQVSNSQPDSPVFPNRYGGRLSRSGVEQRLRAAVAGARNRCPSLKGRRVSPHTLRHTTAMHLLESGVDITVIALWLGHESPATTHLYVEADLAMKERALKALQPPPRHATRYRAPPTILAFLDRL
jgi:site-specific recombinase XerD